MVLIAGGVTAGIIVSNNNKKVSSGGKNGGDPSVFTKDVRLHKSFYGMAYTPEGSMFPECGNSLGIYLPCFTSDPSHSKGLYRKRYQGYPGKLNSLLLYIWMLNMLSFYLN